MHLIARFIPGRMFVATCAYSKVHVLHKSLLLLHVCANGHILISIDGHASAPISLEV